MSELINYSVLDPTLKIDLVLYGIRREIFYDIDARVHVHKPTFKFNNRVRFISTIRTLWYLRQAVKRISPDVILSFGEYWNNFVLLSLMGLHYPIFVSDRSQPDKGLGGFHELLRKNLYRKARGVIAQTEQAKRIYYNLYQHPNIRVIGNPIRKIQARPLVKKENIVLSVGRLISSKNFDKLINAFLDLEIKDWKLIIVGYDHLKQNNYELLDELIKRRGAESIVELVGKQEVVDQFYLRSKIFAFMSESEGFPNVIGEAMSAGLPVISYDCSAGPSEIVENGKDGFLVAVGDYEGFKSKLRLLMENPDMVVRLGENARRSISRFSLDVIGKQYWEFLGI